MAAKKSTQVRHSELLGAKILDYQKVTKERYTAGAVRHLIKKGLVCTPQLGPYHAEAMFNAMSREVRKAIQIEQDVFDQVNEYRAANSLTFEQAFLEFILRGLESHLGAPVSDY